MNITQAAQVDMLQDILRDPCTARLYVNESLPDEPTAADFTEPNGGGYAGKPLRAAAWDLSQAPEVATYPTLKWEFNGPAGPGMVQGYYVTRNSDGRLRWFDQLNGGPQRVVNDGDNISVTVELEFCDMAEPDNDADDIVQNAGA